MAFAAWCNAQGGIGGLKIELIDMDGKLFEVEAAMQKGCGNARPGRQGQRPGRRPAVLGQGRLGLPPLQAHRHPGVRCVSAKSMSNGQVQLIPNPTNTISNTWFRDFFALYPDQAARWAPVWGNLPSLKIVAPSGRRSSPT